MLKAVRLSIVVIAFHVVGGSLAAQNMQELVSMLEARIPKLMQAQHVPGLSMVLIRKNRIVWKGTFGVRVAEKPEKVDEQTIFEAASMSKPLFTYRVLKLVEDGRFDLDVPLDIYLPQPYLPDQPLAAKITARMVMLHRTGLPNWRKGGYKSGGPLPVLFEPGSSFGYSGEGYLYLQTAVEHVTKQSMSTWMQTTLLAPMNMSHSGYQWCEAFKTNFAGGHDKNGHFKKGRRFYTDGNVAYSLYTTPTDYAQFLIEMMRPDRSAPYSLSADMIKKMTTRQVEPEADSPRSNRALGWAVDRKDNGGWVSHSGSNGSGFRCNSRFNIKQQCGSVIMTNSVNGREVWEAILALIDSLPDDGKSFAEIGSPEKDGKFTTWGAARRTIRYNYRLMNPTSKPVTKIRVNVPLPLESPRQKIHYLHLPERKPSRVFTDEHGQKIVRYSIDRLEPGQYVDLGYVVGITLSNMRWSASRQSTVERAPVLTPDQRRRYLKSETNYSMDDDMMRRTATSLVQGIPTDFDKLVRIHDHVINKIRYVLDDNWDSAAAVLARGTGSCSEYNYVLSGLCRLAGLPTRCVGGTIDGFRDLPTTDVVYHRWTEVFLTGYGWFPVDCSRDANPIRGKRSHFGRVYTDAMVWCHQAGGKDDTLGWDYRAKAHVQGDNPGIRASHRTRWFVFHPEHQLKTAYKWLVDGVDGVRARPVPDALECALLRWHEAKLNDHLRLIQALADAGRNVSLRWAAVLPESSRVRENCVRRHCSSKELADTLLENSHDVYGFRNWFRKNESRLVPAGEGRFALIKNSAKKQIQTTTALSSRIWGGLVPEVVRQLSESESVARQKTAVIMPVTDQTMAGLGKHSASIDAALKKRVVQETSVKLIDQACFSRSMNEQGPGSGEYWILANDPESGMPPELVPDIILVPIAITSRVKQSVLYDFQLKVLELHSRKYTKAIACTYRKAKKEPKELPTDLAVLVAGGDTMLARWQHDMVIRNGYDWPLAGVKDVLRSADAAFANLECCVSLRGTPVDKGERCSFYYRARPEMLNCLTRAGIDIVNAANNHAGDYGPLSVADTAKWCKQAGLVCVGCGSTSTAAETPRLVQIGSVRVGIAGMDSTTSCFCAESNRPGTSYAADGDKLTSFAEKMKRLGQWAKGHCDLLVLTVHWGDNWVRETQPSHRKMARIAFEHGVDLILGHSAHQLQGIEIVAGKAVLYDMGNLLFDCRLKPEGRNCALFRLHLSAVGVDRIEILPTQVLNGHTVLARCNEASETLAEMRDLCATLGTTLSIDEDLAGRPVGVLRIPNPKTTSHGPPEKNLVGATFPITRDAIPAAVDKCALTDQIPSDAHRLNPPVELAAGVQLLAFHLPNTAKKGGILRLATWWQVTGPVARNIMPAFQLRPRGEMPRRGTPWYTRHDAGDWTVPLARLKPGSIVEDRYPTRLAGIPAGPLKVYAVILDTARPEGMRVLGQPYFLGELEIHP